METQETVVPTPTPATLRLLTAEEVLEAPDIQIVTVPIPEWNGAIRLRTLSAADALGYAKDMRENPRMALAALVQKSAIKEDGSALFTPEQVDKLSGKSMRSMRRIQEAVLDLNGLADKAKETAKND